MTPTELIAALERDTDWVRTSWIRIPGDIGHPQGLTRWGDGWLVSTVHPEDQRGELLAVARNGRVRHRIELVDGPRWHPGGIHAAPDGPCLIALAEYAPDSTTSVWQLDDALQPTLRFTFADHLGAVCPLADGTMFAVSWGSRTLYRLDADGDVLHAVANPSCFIDHQDVQLLDDGTVLTSGVGGYTTPRGRVQLGGYAGWDAYSFGLRFEVPVNAWSDSGRVVTYNAVHTELDVTASVDPSTGERLVGATVRLHSLPDDTRGMLSTWTAAVWVPED